MEFSSLFASTDNLYKFLFSGGILMVAFSLFYPIEKKQLLELEVNTYNKQTELLNQDISRLNLEVGSLKKENIKTLLTLEKLSKTKNNSNKIVVSKEIEEIQKKYNTHFFKTKSEEQEVIIKKINIKYNMTIRYLYH